MTDALHPPIEPLQRSMLDVGDGHALYYEVSGNTDAPAVLFLHGGPGSCTNPNHRRFFDPARWRIVLFDQRGCGQSTPPGSLEQNTTQALLADIERLRTHLGIGHWVLFGGSWGCTLGLAYAIAYPERVLGLVLRGVFLGSRAEVDWFLYGLRLFLPEAWRQLSSGTTTDSLALVSRFSSELHSPAGTTALDAARRWDAWERAVIAIEQGPSSADNAQPDQLLARVRVQMHYVQHDFFLAPGELLEGLPRLRELPAIIVQGRLDLVCPPLAAYTLAESWPAAELRIVEAGGHVVMHPPLAAALVQATDEISARLGDTRR